MSFLTTTKVAELLGIKIHLLKNFIQSDRHALLFFRKELCDTQFYSHKLKRYILKERLLWGMDEGKLNDFETFWLSRTQGRPRIYNNQQDRLAWTPTAIECYKRNCKCSPTCSSYLYCKELPHPPIKKKVIEIYTILGNPIGE